MDAFFLIDKPIGITSFDVIRKLRKLTQFKKIGHTGTLDPLATGLLLIAFGNYTKLIPYFEKDRKTYNFEISLDGTTPSFDSETELSRISKTDFDIFKKKLKKEDILKILQNNFTGKIEQIPPKYSALKINGKKALELVRKGIDFKIKKREINIFNIKITSFNYPLLELEAEVSAGTYIRSIASDLGEILGTGGYITKLRRTKIGELELTSSTLLEDVNNQNKLDIKKIFYKNNFIDLDSEILKKINFGQKVKNTINLIDGEYFIKNDEYITNIIEVSDNTIKQKRRIV